jgi:hypothetical protein
MSVSLVISYFIPFLILDKLYRVIQKERNILGGGSIGHKEKKKFDTNMCLILNRYCDIAV